MILIDTNVVSETMRPAPAPQVIEWLDAQRPDDLFLSTISLSELLFGVAMLPDGRRRQALGDTLTGQLLVLFGARLLAFDEKAARAYAGIAADARRAGRAIGVADGQIAAIAVSRGLAVATRDTTPFLDAGLTVVDPWANAGR